jgi:hypothetical protein
MAAYDLLRESAGRSRRYGDFLRSLEDEAAPPSTSSDEDDGPVPEISRTHYSRLESELHYDAGWLLGAIHGAMVCGQGEHIDGHLEGLANGIEELMISYDRIQDLIGIMPPRHCVFFDEMAVLQEEPRRRRHSP